MPPNSAARPPQIPLPVSSARPPLSSLPSSSEPGATAQPRRPALLEHLASTLD